MKYLKHCYYCSTYEFSNLRRSSTLRRKTLMASLAGMQTAADRSRKRILPSVISEINRCRWHAERWMRGGCSPAVFRPKYASRRLGRLSIGFGSRGSDVVAWRIVIV